MLIEQIIYENPGFTKLVLMPGRFQPPHIGHMKAWKHLNDKFGNAYIVTSDKVEPPRSPFTFQEKKRLFMFAGVPTDRIVQVKNPYRADEIVSKFDPEKTVLIFAVSEKDMSEDPRFSFAPKKDGSDSYLQPYKKNIANLQPITKHGYVATVPTFSFNVNGEPMRSATEFRSNFSKADDSTQARMIRDLYGDYDTGVHNLMREKIV
jgi:hypothetical protein